MAGSQPQTYLEWKASIGFYITAKTEMRRPLLELSPSTTTEEAFLTLHPALPLFFIYVLLIFSFPTI